MAQFLFCSVALGGPPFVLGVKVLCLLASGT